MTVPLARRLLPRWSALGASSTRDPWPDNARFIAAVLIVERHFTGYMRADSGLLTTLDMGMWGLRLPVYIIIAGYFSRNDGISGRRAVQLLRNIAFVYLALYALAWVQMRLLGIAATFNPIEPSYTLWFLISLFCWRVMLPLAATMRFLLPISVAAAVGVGFIDGIGSTMSLSRTIAFFPLFLLGWYLRQDRFRRLLDLRPVRLAALPLIAAGLVGGYLVRDVLKPSFFEMSGHYPGALDGRWGWAALRLAILCYGAVIALALMALVPRRRVPIMTYLGSGSFYIYLLHPLIRRQLIENDLLPETESRAQLAAYMLAVAALACLLGSRPVRWATRWLIQPRYEWLFQHHARR